MAECWPNYTLDKSMIYCYYTAVQPQWRKKVLELIYCYIFFAEYFSLWDCMLFLTLCTDVCVLFSFLSFSVHIVHSSVPSYWWSWLVCCSFADWGLCLHNSHCSSQQCTTSVSCQCLYLNGILWYQYSTWICWHYQSRWIMCWSTIHLPRTYYCTKCKLKYQVRQYNYMPSVCWLWLNIPL